MLRAAKAAGLETSEATSEPVISAGSRLMATRRSAAIETYSAPWMPAGAPPRGGGRAPLMITTGIWTVALPRFTGTIPVARSPGAARRCSRARVRGASLMAPVCPRLLVRGQVAHRRRVEDHDVGLQAVAQEAPIRQPQACRRRRGHLAHGLLEARQALLAHELAQHAGGGAVGARRLRSCGRGRRARRGCGPGWCGRPGAPWSSPRLRPGSMAAA